MPNPNINDTSSSSTGSIDSSSSSVTNSQANTSPTGVTAESSSTAASSSSSSISSSAASSSESSDVSSSASSSAMSSSISSSATSSAMSSSESSSLESSSTSSSLEPPVATNTTILTILQKPSPFYSETYYTPIYIILHTIGCIDPLQALLQNNISYHFVIPLQNSTKELYAYQLIDMKLGWTTLPTALPPGGKSMWHRSKNINSFSLHIALSMPSFACLAKGRDSMHFGNYQAEQITALKMLIAPFQKQYYLSAKSIVPHSDVSPWQTDENGEIVMGSTDTGPTLPWQELAEANIGIMPLDSCTDFEYWYPNGTALTAGDAQDLLNDVGYNAGRSRQWDAQTNFTLKAARARWTPQFCFNNATQSAAACYEDQSTPLDYELACDLYNVGNGLVKDYAKPANVLPWILGGLGVLGGFMLLYFIIEKCRKYCNKNRYRQFSDADAQNQNADFYDQPVNDEIQIYSVGADLSDDDQPDAIQLATRDLNNVIGNGHSNANQNDGDNSDEETNRLRH